MNQSEAQAKYKELREKVKVAEKPWPVGMAAGLERLTFKNDLNHFKQRCADQGITLLEPCPFCGSYDLSEETDAGTYNYVRCSYCSTDGPSYINKAKAIAAWNTRVN